MKEVNQDEFTLFVNSLCKEETILTQYSSKKDVKYFTRLEGENIAKVDGGKYFIKESAVVTTKIED